MAAILSRPQCVKANRAILWEEQGLFLGQHIGQLSSMLIMIHGSRRTNLM